MLTLSFLRTESEARSKPIEKVDRTDLTETVFQARAALREKAPGRALSLLAPWLGDENPPAEARLIAGRALTALGRYPEALGLLEEYLAEHPNSVEGLLAAGIAAASARELARAVDWFNRAAHALSGRALSLIEPLGSLEHPDPIALEEMVAEVESYPGDRDRALALACALGRSGHFRAVERFLAVLDKAHS